MNAPAQSSRRQFLTRLFADPQTRRDDTELTPIAELRRHTDGVLWAAVVDSEDQLYIAGDEGAVFHFNGQQWCREEFPSNLPVHALCPLGDNIYSVGWLGLICERSDGQWRKIQGGEKEAATSNLPLFDIAADNKGNLWAVGDQGRIVQFDGIEWREHSSGSSANLRSVLPLADGRVLVGGSGGTILQWDGNGWEALHTDASCPITGLAELGHDAVIAVGGEYDIDDGQFRGRIFLYSEGQWQAIDSEHPLPRLRRVRRAGDSLLICGDDGTAFRWTAEGAQRLPCRLRYDLQDIITSSDGQVMICGDGGTLLQETTAQADATPEPDQQHWRQISRGETNRTLRAIWPVGDNQLIAVGDGGTALHINDDQVTLHSTPQQLRIHSLWGSSPRNIYAACDSATILHFDGSEWSVAHRGNVDTALLAITGFGPHDIFAVGDNGYALRYDGLMWRQLETGAKQELYGLWGQDSQHLLAVGGGGLVLRWNGEHWKTFSAGTDHDLYGVSGSGLEKLFITGLAGTIIRFEDNAWHKDFSGVHSDLHAVTNSDGAFYAVGSNGSVLRNAEGIWEPERSGCHCTLQAVTTAGYAVYAVGSGGVVLKRPGM